MNLIYLLVLLFTHKKIRNYSLLMLTALIGACVSMHQPYPLSDKLEKDNSPAQKTNTYYTKISKENINLIIEQARTYIGTPHRDKSAEGIDCSGLTKAAYASAGFELRPRSSDQSQQGREISKEELQPGDLVFFGSPQNPEQISHVGLVTRVGATDQIDFIHTSTTRGVVEESMLSRYWVENYIKAIRPFAI